jgi:hypothetical protein
MATNKPKRKRKPKRTLRPRVLQSPNAHVYTLPGYQALGGPGKTSVYKLAKAGKLEIFKDALGRTLITGKSGRAFLGVEEEVSA